MVSYYSGAFQDFFSTSKDSKVARKVIFSIFFSKKQEHRQVHICSGVVLPGIKKIPSSAVVEKAKEIDNFVGD